MIYTINNVSAQKFSLNGVELFKVYIPKKINDTLITVVNVYDSGSVLIPIRAVSDFVVDGNTFTNSTDLIGALNSVIYVRSGNDGAIDSVQIEANRVAIAALDNDKSDAGHLHDDRYYTQTQVDQKLQSLATSNGTVPVSGAVDGDKIKFRDSQGNQIFQIDAKTFLSQGTILSFEKSKLQLKDAQGNVLSSAIINASYYDRFKLLIGPDNPADATITTDFSITFNEIADVYYFIVRDTVTARFDGARILINDTGAFQDLGVGQTDVAGIIYYEIYLDPTEYGAFDDGSLLKFDYWFTGSESDDTKADRGDTTSTLEQVEDVANYKPVFSFRVGTVQQEHYHTVFLTADQVTFLLEQNNIEAEVTVTSNEINGHVHEVSISYDKSINDFIINSITSAGTVEHQAELIGYNNNKTPPFYKYDTQVLLLADQENQTENYAYYIKNTNTFYIYKGTTNSSLENDYIKFSFEEFFKNLVIGKEFIQNYKVANETLFFNTASNQGIAHTNGVVYVSTSSTINKFLATDVVDADTINNVQSFSSPVGTDRTMSGMFFDTEEDCLVVMCYRSDTEERSLVKLDKDTLVIISEFVVSIQCNAGVKLNGNYYLAESRGHLVTENLWLKYSNTGAYLGVVQQGNSYRIEDATVYNGKIYSNDHEKGVRVFEIQDNGNLKQTSFYYIKNKDGAQGLTHFNGTTFLREIDDQISKIDLTDILDDHIYLDVKANKESNRPFINFSNYLDKSVFNIQEDGKIGIGTDFPEALVHFFGDWVTSAADPLIYKPLKFSNNTGAGVVGSEIVISFYLGTGDDTTSAELVHYNNGRDDRGFLIRTRGADGLQERIRVTQNKVTVEKTIKAIDYEGDGSKLTGVLKSTTVNEPFGATEIQNIVSISQADYDAAFNAATLVETTIYLILEEVES